MIPFFPKPYPDELLYSICARYADRVQYSSSLYVLQELFGSKCQTVIFDLPYRLGHLISILPNGHQYTVEQLIYNHTMLPVYLPFLDDKKLQKVLDMMKGKDSEDLVNPKKFLKLNKYSTFFRFCPLCFQEDKQRYGEYYWHRLHNFSAVIVCPIHHVFLENSNVFMSQKTHNYEFFSATKVVLPDKLIFIEQTNPAHQILLKISQDVQWLLNFEQLEFQFESLFDRYIQFLIQLSLANKGGTIQLKSLLKKFLDYYPQEVLKILDCQIDEKIDNPWLFLIVPNLKKNKAHSLIYHLLLIQFFGKTAEEFFKTPLNFSAIRKPFGQGLWPCLDPTSDHYRQLTINTYRINRRNHQDEATATFRCSCGFAYARTGPDLAPEDQYRYTRIVSYSTSWETTLKKLWLTPTITIREIAIQLGLSISSVNRYAKRLNLPLHRITISGQLPKTDCHLSSEVLKKKESYRQEWLIIRENNPTLNRAKLQQNFRRHYSWLYKNDSDWLEENLPLKLDNSIDWPSRDTQLMNQIIQAVSSIKSSPNSPIKITVIAISKELNISHNLLNNNCLKQMPLTAQVLSQVLETWEDFTLRRIEWMTQYYLQEGICPSRNQFIKRLNPNHYKRQSASKIDDAISQAVEFINSYFTSSLE